MLIIFIIVCGPQTFDFACLSRATKTKPKQNQISSHTGAPQRAARAALTANLVAPVVVVDEEKRIKICAALDRHLGARWGRALKRRIVARARACISVAYLSCLAAATIMMSGGTTLANNIGRRCRAAGRQTFCFASGSGREPKISQLSLCQLIQCAPP